MTDDSECEPEPMREIHEIRLRMYEEFKGLSVHEIAQRVKKSAEIERKRIFGEEEEKQSGEK